MVKFIILMLLQYRPMVKGSCFINNSFSIQCVVIKQASNNIVKINTNIQSVIMSPKGHN